MRLTNKLFAQHLGWTFKKHWQVQGKRVLRDTNALAELEKLGIAVKDAQEVLAPKAIRERVVFDNFKVQIPEDETHPNWHPQACHIVRDSNVLLEGLPQAQLLTKTIEIGVLPKHIQKSIDQMQFSNAANRNIQNAIIASHVFDAEQVKLPKKEVPQRPMYNLPREYGISNERKNRQLINKIIFECEKLAAQSVSSRHKFVDNVNFKVTLPKDGELLQFEVCAEKMITSSRPLEPVKNSYDAELPDLYPMKCTVTVPKANIYTTNNLYPFSSTLNCAHPHTVFLNFSRETVKNLHESAVTPTQFQGRTLLKAFAVAAARAKQLYGDSATDTGTLPKPVTVQSIQTDGRSFHFGIFQLNSLALDGIEGTKNYFFHVPNMDLFSQCRYHLGKPILEGYNNDVLRYIYSFYCNT